MLGLSKERRVLKTRPPDRGLIKGLDKMDEIILLKDEIINLKKYILRLEELLFLKKMTCVDLSEKIKDAKDRLKGLLVVEANITSTYLKENEYLKED